MADEVTAYVVGRGEYLLEIALRFGLEPDDIWNHPKNAALKKQRDPNVLAPGDVLYVPAPPAPTLRVSPKTSNRYQATVPTVSVRLQFMGATAPLANEPYEVHGLPAPTTGSTDASGLVSFDAPISVKTVRVAFPKRYVEHTVNVGGLDPVGTPSGISARLAHLGYAPIDASDDAIAAALRGFQASAGLPASGRPDPATLDALTKAHGGL